MVSVDDRGFLFGDGLYEVLRCINGRYFRLDSHLRRLDQGIKALNIELSGELRAGLPKTMQKLIEMNRLENLDSLIYLQITRGAAFPRTHAYPAESTEPTVMITASPFQPNRALQLSGADAITVPDLRWSGCNLKTLNLLPNIMLAQLARERNVFGAVMIREGVITEGYNNNVFAIRDGALCTHPESPHILSGITREVVIEIAETAGIPLLQIPVSESEIYEASEVILTGTSTEIQPVIRINDHIIGDGKPGPVAQLLREELNKQMY